MNRKKEDNVAKVEPVAEVRLGEYVARFTEENLKDLLDLVEFVNEDMHSSINEYYDYFLDIYSNDRSRAEELMKQMDGLRGYAWWFDRVKDFDIRHETK